MSVSLGDYEFFEARGCEMGCGTRSSVVAGLLTYATGGPDTWDGTVGDGGRERRGYIEATHDMAPWYPGSVYISSSILEAQCIMHTLEYGWPKPCMIFATGSQFLAVCDFRRQ